MFRKYRTPSILIVSAAALLTTLYLLVVPGLSVARNEPSQLEVQVATWLLRNSVPASAANMANPLKDDQAAITAGTDLFRQKCEVCHGSDGSGKTEIGSGAFPRPPALRTTVLSLTDGEIFYHIRNG